MLNPLDQRVAKLLDLLDNSTFEDFNESKFKSTTKFRPTSYFDLTEDPDDDEEDVFSIFKEEKKENALPQYKKRMYGFEEEGDVPLKLSKTSSNQMENMVTFEILYRFLLIILNFSKSYGAEIKTNS